MYLADVGWWRWRRFEGKA